MGHLTAKDKKRIINLIYHWSEPKLSWPLLVGACQTKLNISRTRQSLMSLPDVNMAMKDRRIALKARKNKPSWIKDVYDANERIEKLTYENQKLKAINLQMLERFIRWQANADKFGVTQAKLDEPLG